MHSRVRFFATLTILIISLLLSFTSSFGQRSVQGKSVSLGGEPGVTVRGAEAIGWNPAFLAFSDAPRYSFYTPVINAGSRLYNNSFSISLINKYFQEDKYLNTRAKQDILDHVPDDGLAIRGDMSTFAAGFSFPTQYLMMAINVDVFSYSDAEIDKDFIKLGLFGSGFEDLGKERHFDKLEAESITYARGSITGAKRFLESEMIENTDWLDELTVGFTFSYTMGLAYLNVKEASASIYTAYGEVDGNGLLVADTSRSGYGVGLDLGLATKILNRRGIIGLSLINLVNTVHWTDVGRNLYNFETDFRTWWGDPISAPSYEGIDDIEDWIDENFPHEDTIDTLEEVSSKLPSSLILTGGWYLKQGLLLTGTYRQGLNHTAGSMVAPRFTVGAEYMLTPKFPVRTGLGIGSRGGVTLGGGAGIRVGPWHSDIGFSYEGGLFNYTRGLTFAMSTSFFFGMPSMDPFINSQPQQRKQPKKKSEDEFIKYDDE